MLLEITREPDVAPPPRRFVPEGFDAGDPKALKALARKLLAKKPDSAAAFEAWILDWSDIARALGAVRTRRRIAMLRDTGDAAARESYLAIERDVMPLWDRLQDEFHRGYLASPYRKGLGARYVMLDKRFAARADLFRDVNVPLLAEEEMLGARYAKLAGERSVTFRGTKMREQECGALLEDADRSKREDAFKALAVGRAKDADETEKIFDELLALRDRIARNAGCKDYVEYRFRDFQRFDYGPKDCVAFHDAVERYAVPAVTALMEKRRKMLGLATIRPYDLVASPDGRTLGRPFADEASLVDLGCRIFRAVDPFFEEQFRILVRNRLLDLMARPGKAPGGFNTDVQDLRLPFVYANSVGRHQDVTTFLHEGGHAFHTLATRDEPVPELSHAPIEFCEVASMSMELFGLEHFESMFPRDDAREAARRLLEHRLTLLPWIATIDAFQHWIYTHPTHSRAERREEWVRIRRRFSPHIDWSGLEDALWTGWHAQIHIFEYALYYIEYGIASLGSLQLWQRFRRDRKAAVAGYRKGLALGGSRPLPDLFAAAGTRLAMDGPAVKEAVDGIVARFTELG